MTPESVLAQARPYSQDDARQEQVLARSVLDYLAEHPLAMDTLEGIAEWWVMRDQVRVDVQMLERVLRRLTEDGILQENRSGSQIRYCLKKRPARAAANSATDGTPKE
jgi:hypothetical protein